MATLASASPKFRSAGAVSTGFDSPTISSIWTRPASMSLTSARRSASCSLGTASGAGV